MGVGECGYDDEMSSKVTVTISECMRLFKANRNGLPKPSPCIQLAQALTSFEDIQQVHNSVKI